VFFARSLLGGGSVPLSAASSRLAPPWFCLARAFDTVFVAILVPSLLSGRTMLSLVFAATLCSSAARGFDGPCPSSLRLSRAG